MTVNGAGGLSNGVSSYITIQGSSTDVAQATLNVANAVARFGTKGVETGTVVLTDDALLEFKSGEITTIDGELELNSAKARVADAGSTSTNSALTGLTTIDGYFLLANGATVTTTGNLSLTADTLELDGPYDGGSGSTNLTIGGNLTNSSTNGYGVWVGNTGITSADTLTVKGTGGLTNDVSSYITIQGSSTDVAQATLNVANAVAGFGTKGVETGTVVLTDDALLEFKSGEITTIDGELELNSAKARVADAGSTSTNSALTGLTTVDGYFLLANGATVTTTGNLSLTADTLELDGPYDGGSGSTNLTIGGNLTNSSTNGYGVWVGNTGITSADTLTVKGTGGLTNDVSSYITIQGSSTDVAQATLNVANAVAGFGTKGVETGTVVLTDDALLEFKSGEITTIDGELELNSAKARVADAGSTSTNSALTGLTTVDGYFLLANGATVTTTGNLSLTADTLELDGPYDGGSGSTNLTIGGNLTNSSTNGYGVWVGNTGITSADTLTVKGTGGLTNDVSSYITIQGSSTDVAQATLNVANAVAGFGTKGVETGTVVLTDDALLEFESGEITTIDGELQLNSAKARVADAGSTSTNSALTGLTTVDGYSFWRNGATVTTTGNLSLTGDTLELDGPYDGGSGGTSLTIGGNLTNSSTNGYGVWVGNTGITSADTLTVKGTGGLFNTGYITIQGSASATAKLVVTDTATSSGTISIDSSGDLTATDSRYYRWNA